MERGVKPIIAWWSGGVTSAVACKIALDLFLEVRVVFIDTKNEHPDTYRFLVDCETWYGCEIEIISSNQFENIEAVWEHYGGMNFAHGAICSTELKRAVRIAFEKENDYLHEVFGFEADDKEIKRAKAMSMNYPESKPIYPLLMYWLSKQDCANRIKEANIEIPISYQLGFNNNNCLGTGCVRGGIGYWQKYARDFPDQFDKMAQREHRFSERKGEPVTMLKDRRDGKDQRLFLKRHPFWPEIAELSETKGREPKPLNDCNGFGCAVNDFMPKNETENEL